MKKVMKRVRIKVVYEWDEDVREEGFDELARTILSYAPEYLPDTLKPRQVSVTSLAAKNRGPHRIAFQGGEIQDYSGRRMR